MSFFYWAAVIISILAFGRMTKHAKYKSHGIWIPLFIISFITAIFLSDKIIVGIITGVVLFFGNGIFWAIFWDPLNMNGTRMPRFIKQK